MVYDFSLRFFYPLKELQKTYSKHKEHIKLIEYYEKNWLPLLLDRTIFYQDLRGNLDRMRANSVLENYHAELKENLTLNPRWEKFIDVLIQKEKQVVEQQTRKEKQGFIREYKKWEKKYFPDKTVKYKKLEFSQFGILGKNELNSDKIYSNSENTTSGEENELSESYYETDFENIGLSFEWIKWQKNSCRYDSFLTVFCLVLFNKHEDLFNFKTFFNDCLYNEPYNYLVQTAQFLNEKKFEARFDFWTFMSLPIHPSKTGLTKVPLDSEPVGKFGSVSNLITLFHNLSFMELYCLVRTNCNECNKKTIKRTILRMPIILENISAVCVQGCINKKFFEKKSDFCCDKCQNFSKSESCRIMTSPPYLILYLETNGNSIIFENQSFIYDEEIEFFSLAGGDSPSKYKLVASINSPSPVHFNCSIKDPR